MAAVMQPFAVGTATICCNIMVAFLFNKCLQCFDTVGWASGRAFSL